MNTLDIKNRNLKNKTKKIKENGFVPGTLYGANVESIPIKMKRNQLSKKLKQSGEVYEISTKFGKINAKFEEIQRDPVTREFIHFSLVELPKDQVSEVDIPIEFKGTPVGVRKGGVFVVVKDEIALAGKPSKLPEKIIEKVNKMDIGDVLTTEDLKTPNSVEVLEDEVVAVCKPPVKETNISNVFEEEETFFSSDKNHMEMKNAV